MAGIEYEKFLSDISVLNISRLKQISACTSYNLDARKFKNFADFDNLFLFNPFDDDIYVQVISAVRHQILQSDLSKPRYIICHGVYNIEAMKSSGLFSLIREDCCPYRGNLFRVFKSIDNA